MTEGRSEYRVDLATMLCIHAATPHTVGRTDCCFLYGAGMTYACLENLSFISVFIVTAND